MAMKSDTKFLNYGVFTLISLAVMIACIVGYFIIDRSEWVSIILVGIFGLVSIAVFLIFLFLSVFHYRRIKYLPEADKQEILYRRAYEEDRKKYG